MKDGMCHAKYATTLSVVKAVHGNVDLERKLFDSGKLLLYRTRLHKASINNL